jgi:hypothetical protein
MFTWKPSSIVGCATSHWRSAASDAFYYSPLSGPYVSFFFVYYRWLSTLDIINTHAEKCRLRGYRVLQMNFFWYRGLEQAWILPFNTWSKLIRKQHSIRWWRKIRLWSDQLQQNVGNGKQTIASQQQDQQKREKELSQNPGAKDTKQSVPRSTVTRSNPVRLRVKKPVKEGNHFVGQSRMGQYSSHHLATSNRSLDKWSSTLKNRNHWSLSLRCDPMTWTI